MSITNPFHKDWTPLQQTDITKQSGFSAFMNLESDSLHEDIKNADLCPHAGCSYCDETLKRLYEKHNVKP